ncbi:MAG: VWA domain-containing protein [Clostridia bacterium]|nr:VWA domain-containing protein [Clostridia bacterium]
MITNPIIPVWLMTIICIVLIFILFFDFRKFGKRHKDTIKVKSPRNIIKYKIYNGISKTIIIILLFLMNLRFMTPNGETTQITYDVDILFVIDKSVSMRALDYNGEKERMEGVADDCCYIVDTLNGAKYSIITFGDTAEKLVPFTSDADLIKAELKAIITEDDFYASGTSINLVKKTMEDALKSEQKKQGGSAKNIVFFISDGEITKEGEEMESFSSLKKYILGGAVMGYGTESGGKMVSRLYKDDPTSSGYYVYYYDKKYNKITAISKIDEDNLKKIASDLSIGYVHMDKKTKIDSTLKELQKQMLNSQTTDQKLNTYQDTYYYIAIALAIFLVLDLIIRKRSL